MDPELEARMRRSFLVNAWVSTPLVLLAGVGYAVYVGTGWSWALFVWGVAIGPAWVLGIRGVLRLANRLGDASSAEAAEHRRASWNRYRLVYVSTIGTSVFAGIFSASSEDPLADIAFSVVGAVGLLIPLAMLPAIAKKSAAQRGAREV